MPKAVFSPVRHLSSSSASLHMSTSSSYEQHNIDFKEQQLHQEKQKVQEKLTCPYCGKSFSHERTLNEHRRTRHAELENAKIKERIKAHSSNTHHLEQRQEQRNVYLYDLLHHQEHLTQHPRQTDSQRATHALQSKLTSSTDKIQPRAFTHSMLVSENAQLAKEIRVLEKEYEQMKERIMSLRTRLANPVFSINSINNTERVTLPLFHAAIPSVKPLPITRNELVLLQKYIHRNHVSLQSPEKGMDGQCEEEKTSEKVKVNSTINDTNAIKTKKNDNEDAKSREDTMVVVATGTGVSQWTGIGVVRGVVRLGYLHGSALHNMNSSSVIAKPLKTDHSETRSKCGFNNNECEERVNMPTIQEQCKNTNVVKMPEVLQFTLETHGYRSTRPGQQRLFRNRVRVRYFYQGNNNNNETNTSLRRSGSDTNENVFVVREGDLICVQGHYARHVSYDVVSKQQRENVVVEADVIGMLQPHSE